MNIIIAGGGKIGYYLAKTLLAHKHKPVVIEIDPHVSSIIANEMDIPVISGDATRYEILCAAKAFDADIFVSVTGNDECNLIACQLAKKEFNVKKTIAKSNNPKNVSVMTALGIDNVINSTDSIASLIEKEVDISRVKQLLHFNNNDTVLWEVTCPEKYVYDGKMLMELKLPNDFNIVSITRNDRLIIPRGQTMLKSNDKVLVISDENAVKQIKTALKIK